MSQADRTPERADQLDDDEKDLFERLASRYDNDVGRIFEIALQSSDDNEEARS